MNFISKKSKLLVKKYVSKTLNTNPRDVIYYIHQNDIDNTTPITASALAYQYLYKTHFNKIISVSTILDEYEGEIGLIGPGNGNCTAALECLFGEFSFCHTHSILHDAYGRFYAKYGLDRGYCYAIKNSTRFMKKSPLFGHISGFFFALFHKI